MTVLHWILTGVAVVSLVLLVVVACSLAMRRQRGGADRLARSLHLNAGWWKDQRAKDGELLYVALGDSAAQGVGASQPGRSYVGLIAQHLRQRTGCSVRVVNLSISGARLREVIALQLAPLRRLSPDIVTVAVGANDMPTFERERFTRELAEVFGSLPAGSIVAEVPSFYLGAAERDARGEQDRASSRHRIWPRGGAAAHEHATTGSGTLRTQPGCRRLLSPQRSRLPGLGIRVPPPDRSGGSFHNTE